MARRTCKECFSWHAGVWIEGYPYCDRACYEKRLARRRAAGQVPTDKPDSKVP